MEINIDSKRNNPLLNRTEVHFTIIHEGGKTPNRDLVRTELADKLNSKKENIVVNYINPSFGLSKSTGYAKIYSSQDKIKDQERKFVLKRNKIGETKKAKSGKEEKSEEKTSEKPQEPKEENKSEDKEEKTEKPKDESSETGEKKEEKTEEPKKDEKKE